jgi:taurine dioxygenase
MLAQDLRIESLRDDLSFGSRIFGATRENLEAETSRQQVRSAFEERGLLIFENVESSIAMHLAVSEIFGPLKEHPDAAVRARASVDNAPGIVSLVSGPDTDENIIELNGKILSGWLPWHFDLPFNNEINRAGVLRAVTIAPDGGKTGFADGIQLYKALSPELQKKIDTLNVIYTMDYLLAHMRFGKPDNIRAIKTAQSTIDFSARANTMPRAMHPAVLTRKSGEKVLHVSGIHSVGIQGHENPEGDALLEQVCQAINANPSAYYHEWRPNQIVAWDNWRMLHCVTGTDPTTFRHMHRTTIEGDYGLGFFEGGGTGGKILETII